MKRLILMIPLLLLLSLATHCRKKNEFLSQHIEKEPGLLSVVNPSGFIGSTVSGTSIEHTLTLLASGGLDLYELNVTLISTDPFSFSGGSYPGNGGTCGSELKSGEFCTLVILYEPTNTNSHLAELQISYRDSIESKSLNYVFTADSHPILSFDYGTKYDFGNKFIGSSTDLKIRVTNSGRSVAENLAINNFTSPYSYKGGSYPGQGGDCSLTVQPGESCSIVINYSPTSNGTHTQEVKFSYLNSNRPEESTLSLTGWGFNKAVLTLSSDNGNDDFGTGANGFSNQKTYTLTHVDGDVSANLLNISNINPPFKRVGGSCGTNLSIDQRSCTMVIEMQSSTSGTWQNTVSFSYHNGAQTITFNRNLTGVTKEKPTLTFSLTGTMDFGLVEKGTSKTLNLLVNYASGELPAKNLTLSSISAPFSIANNTCGSSISSGTCSLALNYSPTGIGVNTSSFSLSFDDWTQTASTIFGLKGMTEALLNASTLNFSTIMAGQSKPLPLPLSFSGGSPATSVTVSSITGSFSLTGGSYPGTSGNCQNTISVNCNLNLTFSPASEGNHTGSLTLTYHNGVRSSSLVISLNGSAAPAAKLTMTDVTFADTSINASSLAYVTITNSSALAATALSITLPSGFSYKGGTFPGTGGNCASSLSGNGNCKLALLFSPTTAASYSASLSLNYFDGGQTRNTTSTLTGNGIATSNIFIAPTSKSLELADTYIFPDTYVGANSSAESFRIAYGGSANPATITSIAVSSNQFTVINSTCPATLTSNQSCLVTVRFSPTTATTTDGSLTVNYQSSGNSLSTTRNLRGIGLTPGLLTVSPNPVNFGQGSIGSAYEQVVTVTRSGGYTISSFTPSLSGSGFTYKGGNYPGTGGSCPSFSGSPATCKIYLSFSPTQVLTYNGQLSLSYSNGFQVVPATINLTGEGKPSAQLSFSSGHYDWGKLIQTTSSEKTLSITNVGTLAATNLALSNLNSPFAFKGGTYPGSGGTCSTTLGASQSCTLQVIFSPTSVGSKNQTLTMQYHNGQITTESSTMLTGEGIAQAIISVSEANPFHFGTVGSGGTIIKTFVLTNAGSVTGTGLSGSFTSSFGFQGGSFPGTGGTCTTSLAPGGTCTVNLTFSPNSAGNYLGSFTLNYQDGLRQQTEFKELRGTAL